MKLADGEYISNRGLYNRTGGFVRAISLTEQIEHQVEQMELNAAKHQEAIERGKKFLGILKTQPELETIITYIQTGVL
jgi:hypothetical protein